MGTDSSQRIRDRSFTFGCAVARHALRLAPQPGVRCIIDQLLKAGTAVGANLEEAKAGSSKREFVRYVEISLREARETVYWLRVCAALDLGPKAELTVLQGEGEQIVRILGAIVISTKRRMLAGPAVFAFCILHFALLMS
jgi:four helix bundle protein